MSWDLSYDRRASGFAEIGHGHTYQDDGSPTSALNQHLADQESRRNALSLSVRRLEKAVDGLRSANDLIDPTHKPPQSNWTPKELREAEARFQDSKRLKVRKR